MTTIESTSWTERTIVVRFLTTTAPILLSGKGMGYPCDSVIDTNRVMHIVGGGEPGVRLMNLDGKEVGRWTNAEFPGLFAAGPHGMWIDADESVYIAEVGAENEFHKFARV